MNSRGVVATILVIQLVLLTFILFSYVEHQRILFDYSMQYIMIASYNLKNEGDDISSDILYMIERETTDESIDDYLSFVNTSFSKVFSQKIKYLSVSNLTIVDEGLEMKREVLVK